MLLMLNMETFFLALMQFSEKLPGYERYILDIFLKKKQDHFKKMYNDISSKLCYAYKV